MPGILVVITLVNLRGTKESGLALAIPTCLFIASLFFIMAVGAWAAWDQQRPATPCRAAA
jgi:amino acid transporter